MAWENEVFFAMLLIMYQNGELDMQAIEQELIEKMSKENFEKKLKEIKENYEKRLTKAIKCDII